MITWFTDDNKDEIKAKQLIKEGINPEDHFEKPKHTLLAENLLLDNHGINILRHGRYKDIYLHNHDYFELEYVISGNINTTIDGYKLVLKPGDLLLLNPHSYHQFESAGPNDTLLNIIIHKDFLPYFVSLFNTEGELFNFISNSIFLNHESNNFIYLHGQDNPKLHNQMINFISNFKDQSSLNSSLNKLQLCEILLSVNELDFVNLHKAKYDYDAQLIIKTYTYINDNLANASLDDIANKLNLTNYSLSKLFKKKTGKTFIKELQRLRFEKAYEMLVSTTHSIDDISRTIGYDNLTFFYRKFTELYGMKPNEIRKSK